MALDVACALTGWVEFKILLQVGMPEVALLGC